MKILARVWTLTLDAVMLIMLFAAPGKEAEKLGERSPQRPERQPFLHDPGALNGDMLSARPAYARVRQNQPRR